jgi:hypothetical protein
MSFSFSFFDLTGLLGRSTLARERQPRCLPFGQSRVNGVGAKLFQCSFLRVRRRISSFDEIRSFRPTHLTSQEPICLGYHFPVCDSPFTQFPAAVATLSP